MSTNKQNNYLLLHTKCLRYAGISLNKENLWYDLYSFVAMALMGFYGLLLLANGIMIRDHLASVFDNICYGILMLSVDFNYISMYVKRQSFGKLIAILRSETFAPKPERGGVTEIKLMDECTYYSNLQIKILLSIVGTNVLIQVALTTLTRAHDDKHRRTLPYGNITLIDLTYSPVYEIAYILELITVYFITTSYLAITTIIAGAMAYLAYNCKFLKNYISLNFERTVETNSEDYYYKKTIKEIVDYHNEIRKLVNDFDEASNMILLLQYFCQGLVTCLNLFSCTVTIKKYDMRIISHFEIATVVMMLQFVAAYWGNELITESESIGDVCYGSDFVGGDIRLQKMLTVIIENSKPMKLSVGRFSSLSRTTFLLMMRSAYSYAALLQNFRKRL